MLTTFGSGPVRRRWLILAAGIAAVVGWSVPISGTIAYAASGNGVPQWAATIRPSATASTQALLGVAAVSARNVWAVGTLIVHWNGRKWSVVAGAKTRKCHAELQGISAASSSEIWAVGVCVNAQNQTKPIIERWNGRHWVLQASPRVGTAGISELFAVKAISASDAWAVGQSKSGSSFRTLIEHWNGHAWKVVASIGPGPHGTTLQGVTAV